MSTIVGKNVNQALSVEAKEVKIYHFLIRPAQEIFYLDIFFTWKYFTCFSEKNISIFCTQKSSSKTLIHDAKEYLPWFQRNKWITGIICGEFFNLTSCFRFLEFSKFTSFFPFLFGDHGDALSLDSTIDLD